MRDSANKEATGNVAAVARKHLLLRLGRWLAAVVALTLICAGSWGIYASCRKQRLEKQATAFATRNDVASAVLVARHLLQIDEHDLIATRLMAELAERSGSIDAIEWRKRMVALQPDDPENQLILARTAMRFGKTVLAGNALNAVAPSARATSQYQQLAGAVALAAHEMEKAEECFSRALAREPANHQIELNLASVQLASANAKSVENARDTLRRLTADPQLRASALRALTADALAHQDGDHARTWSEMLLRETNAPFSDYLLNLEACRNTNDAPEALEKAKTAAAKSTVLVADLIAWMNRHDLAADALAWSASFDYQLAKTQPVPLAIAESMSCLRDWPALARFVEKENWGEQEPLRLAVQSHAIRHVAGNESSSEPATLWHAAIKAAQDRPDQLATIAKLAEGWGYHADAAEVLWQIASGTIGAKEALTGLQQFYKHTHDSHGLLRVAKRALELNPNDLVAANNCASLGLLLSGDSGAQRLAKKLHDDHPNNAAFAATYAFALHLEGKTADALRVIEHLKEQQLRQPVLAAYYVVMLAANGNLERARTFLPAAERASLLPEEQTLLADAARKLVNGS